MSTMRFVDQVIVITGARGTGAHMGERFAREGAGAVIFIDTDESAGKAAIARVKQFGKISLFYKASIINPVRIDAVIKAIVNKCGRIDVLVNHAGGAYAGGDENVNTLLELTPTVWATSIEINLNGPYYCAHAAIPYMKKQNKGVMVHIGSVNGEFALGHPAYSAAKSGLLALNRAIAVELGRYGIRSNVVSPGTVQTPAWDARIKKKPAVMKILQKYYPVQHIMSFDDVAAAVCFLASDEANSITGTELLVDGGLSAGSSSLSQELTQEKL